jgi:hypothetical protein
MSLPLAAYAAARPYIYHLTARENLGYIRATGRLYSTAALLTRAGEDHLAQRRRIEHLYVWVDGHRVMIRDQKPLYEGHISFDADCQLADLVGMLNQRVFFWPCSPNGNLSSYGESHWSRYESESPVLLRISLKALLEVNSTAIIDFCRYNSGAPRTTGGRKSPRGRETFVPPDSFDGPPSDVVEVTALHAVDLPHDVLLATALDSSWTNL